MLDRAVVSWIVLSAIKNGFIAGLAMAASMELGERLLGFKVNLPRIDGKFFLGDRLGPSGTYLAGLVIHSITSISLAAACIGGAVLVQSALSLELGTAFRGLAWALALWVVFGLTVSPAVGLGWFGVKAGRWAGLELLGTHLVYGLTLALLAR